MSQGQPLDELRKQYKAQIEATGWPCGMYQATWRGATGTPDNWGWGGPGVAKFDSNDCMTAVLDALLNQGSIAAWAGDGTSCVVQMIELAYRERDRYRAALEKIANGKLSDINTPLGPLHHAGIALQWEIDAKICREALGSTIAEKATPK